MLIHYKKQLQNCILFQNLTPEELEAALTFFQAKLRTCKPQEALNRVGEPLIHFGLVLSGSVQVAMSDIDGNELLMATAGPGSTFGESLCFLQSDTGVQITALEESRIVLMRSDKVCRETDPLSQELSRRFTAMLARRTLAMNDRIQLLSRNTIRQRLITLFSQQPCIHGCITLPYDRNHLAAYLGVNRPALSRELGRMRDQGLIRFEKNKIWIL